MKNLAVITLGTKEIYDYSRYSFDINRTYCEKHGYTYIQYNKVIDNTRPPAWSKILAIKNHIQSFDWIMWIDADAIFYNHDIRIEERIDDSFNLIIGKSCGDDCQDNLLEDYVNQNTGCFIIRGRVEWSLNLLDLIYSKENRVHHKWWENQALNDIVLQNNPAINSKIKTLDQNLINGYENKLYCYYNYTHDQFIMHYAGISKENRLDCLQHRYGEFKEGKFHGDGKEERTIANEFI